MNEDLPIADVELSVRSMGLLDQLGVKTLGQLAALSENDVMGHPRASRLVHRELTEVLAEHGLKFSND